MEARHTPSLIAAAPDLLEVAQVFLAQYPGGINPGLDAARTLARAAIAKATSEASPLGAEPGSNANDRGREELKPLTKQPPIRERQAEGGETP